MGITGDWDRRMSRRALLRGGGTLAAGLALTGGLGARAFAQLPPGGDPFALGVASGDPLEDGVVLWTRLVRDPLVAGGGMPPQRFALRYEVAHDEAFRRIVRRGTTHALPQEAHSARVELRGLYSGSEYFYRFKFGDDLSPVGRTRTAPLSWSQPRALRFAFASCQNFPIGFFNAYQDAVAQDPDFMVHLGDYIYEGPGGTAPFRPHAPAREIFTLDDYRIRHGQYKTDPDLQAAHAAMPWFVTWDDHEVDNNYADEEADPDMPRDELRARRAAAYQAYWEHMPLRRANKPVGPDMQLYRRFHWGKLATFNALDGRQYRSDQPAACAPGERDASGYCPGALDPRRTKLGSIQREWLLDELATTRARWNVLAQQTAFAPYDRDPGPAREFGAGDNWDGYVAERQRIIDWMVARRTRNPIVLTGDSHRNWQRNVPPDIHDFSAPPVATEFMGTSISSGGDPPNPTTTFGGDPNNPHIQLINDNRGYVLCTVEPQRWTSDYRIVPTVLARDVPASTLTRFVVEDGRPGGVRV